MYDLIEPGVSPYDTPEAIEARLAALRKLPESPQREAAIKLVESYLDMQRRAASAP